MFELLTPRLLIRELDLDDLQAVYQLLDIDLADADMGSDPTYQPTGRRAWLQWTVLGS